MVDRPDGMVCMTAPPPPCWLCFGQGRVVSEGFSRIGGFLHGPCAVPSASDHPDCRPCPACDLAKVREAVARETADHKPSVATGLPCKCFLCAALKEGKP